MDVETHGVGHCYRDARSLQDSLEQKARLWTWGTCGGRVNICRIGPRVGSSGLARLVDTGAWTSVSCHHPSFDCPFFSDRLGSTALRKAWSAYHGRRHIWATPGCRQAKMRILHLCVPMFCVGLGHASLDAVAVEPVAHRADAGDTPLCALVPTRRRGLPTLHMDDSKHGTLSVGPYRGRTVGRGRRGVPVALHQPRCTDRGTGTLEVGRAGCSLARHVVDEDHLLRACRWDRHSPSPSQRS